MHQFFETFFVLPEPSYSSIYPIGQGMALALGWTIFGHPWAGVVLSLSGLLRAVLLDVASLDDSELGARGRIAGRIPIRSAKPMDEQLLGRRGLGISGLPGVRGASQTTGNRTNAGHDLAWRWTRYPSAALITSIFLLFDWSLFFLPVAEKEATKARAIASYRCFDALPADRRHADQNRTCDRQVDHAALYSEPVSIWRSRGADVPIPPIPHRELTPQQQLDYRMQLSFGPAQEKPSEVTCRGSPIACAFIASSFSSAVSGAAGIYRDCEGVPVCMGTSHTSIVRIRSKFLSSLSISLRGSGGVPFRADEH